MSITGFRTLGRSGLKVSPLCLGTMNFGNTQFGCDEASSIRIVHACLDRGLNFLDTANVYAGTASETIVGRAVQGRRDALVIATKAASPLGPGPFDGGASRKHMLKACEDSLRRLATDYIDLYQLHRYDEDTPLEESMRALDDLVRAGKVRYIGVSNWPASAIAEACMIAAANGWEPLVSLQPQYSIIQRDIEVEIVPVCRRFGLGLLPWSPLGGGMLSGKYRAGEAPQQGTRFATDHPMAPMWRTRTLGERNHQIVAAVRTEAERLGVTPAALALAWNMARPGVVAPILGPKSVAQLEDCLAALDVALPEETITRIDAVSEPRLAYPHDFLRMVRGLPVPRPAAPTRD